MLTLSAEGKYRLTPIRIYEKLESRFVMTKKKDKKRKKKDSQLLIRVNGEERDQFLEVCETMDTSGAREIRRFMREFILAHKKE